MTRKNYILHIDNIVCSLTDEAKSVVFNGCGSDGEGLPFLGWVIQRIRVPEDMQVLFLPACLWHDVAAWAGGTSEQKSWSDGEMFWRMCRLAVEARNFTALRWALRSWLAVRVGYAVVKVGWATRPKPLSVSEFYRLVRSKIDAK